MGTVIIQVWGGAAVIAAISLLVVILCKLPVKQKEAEEELPNNVTSINQGRSLRMKQALHLFLQAEEALENDHRERYMALKMQALEAAKGHVNGVQEVKRIC